MRALPTSAEAQRGHAALAAALGVALFLASFGLLHVGPLGRNQIIDTPTYQRYGEAVVDRGEVPYRDISLEYPPGALPAFILPALAPEDDYRAIFELLMALCGAGAIALMVLALSRAGASPRRLLGAAALAGIAPLVLGPVVLTRFDLWPALLVAGALAALTADRLRLGAGLIALAATAKIYPIVLLPIALVVAARRRGRREALWCLLVAVAVLAAVLAPFAALSPDGLLDSFGRQTDRPLQIESLGAAVLLVAGELGLYEPTVVSSFGSQNLFGSLPDALATLQTVLQALAIVAVWLLFASARRVPGFSTRTPSPTDRLFAASAAGVAAFVAFGKVLSPQFLLWLVPLVPLVAGRLGLAASLLFLAAMGLTHAWFPSRYWDLVDGQALPVWLLLARDVALAALACVLAAAIRREPGAARTRWRVRPRRT